MNGNQEPPEGEVIEGEEIVMPAPMKETVLFGGEDVDGELYLVIKFMTYTGVDVHYFEVGEPLDGFLVQLEEASRQLKKLKETMPKKSTIIVPPGAGEIMAPENGHGVPHLRPIKDNPQG